MKKKRMVLMHGVLMMSVAVSYGDVFIYANSGIIAREIDNETVPIVQRVSTDSNGFEHWEIQGEVASLLSTFVLDSTDSNGIIDSVVFTTPAVSSV